MKYRVYRRITAMEIIEVDVPQENVDDQTVDEFLLSDEYDHETVTSDLEDVEIVRYDLITKI